MWKSLRLYMKLRLLVQLDLADSKLGILTWESMRIFSTRSKTSSGHLRNCSLFVCFFWTVACSRPLTLFLPRCCIVSLTWITPPTPNMGEGLVSTQDNKNTMPIGSQTHLLQRTSVKTFISFPQDSKRFNLLFFFFFFFKKKSFFVQLQIYKVSTGWIP